MADVSQQLLDFALGLPEAWEDFPWEESVVKVGKRVFVFLGGPQSRAMSVKLGDSHEQALTVRGVTPTRYGLGRSGWVTVPLNEDVLPLEVLTDWVTESYQLVAPKRLGSRLTGERN